MIESVKIKDFGPIEAINWRSLGNINIVIGNNATGKTFLLKALYSMMKAVEDTGRGHNPKRIDDNLSDRMYWTFQPAKLGELVRKGATKTSLSFISGQGSFAATFGSSTEKKIVDIETTIPSRGENSVFLPAKEVLSLFNIIKKSRDIDQAFGFDDTYLDLVRALEIETTKGRNYENFKAARDSLDRQIDGKVVFENGEWLYKKGNLKFSIYSTSEGIKKIAILDRLLGNRFLSPDSIVFIDEPESALHPEGLTNFMDIIYLLSGVGIQFFIATHSYFVIKKMMLIAKANKKSIPILLFEDGQKSSYADLLDGLPENSIIGESVRLYQEEIGLAFSHE